MNNRYLPYSLPDMDGERGFSLVEQLVVLSLIGLMGGFVASVYLFGDRVITGWERSMRLQNEIHTLAEGISEDIYRAEVIREIGPDYLELAIPGDTSRIYEVKRDSLMRNGRSLNSGDMRLVKLQFKWTEAAGRQGEPLPGEIGLVRVELSLTDRRDTLQLNRAVQLRRPPAWKPVGEEGVEL